MGSKETDLTVNRGTGLVESAAFVSSPNCDDRPPGVVIDVLVVHCISLPPGQYGGPYIEHLFCNRLDPSQHEYFAGIHGARVSSHFLIRRDGGLIQFVPVHKRAWHAGASCLGQRENVNDFSIGIELEGTDDTMFTDQQYDMLIGLSNTLMCIYPEIRKSGLVAHSDIAPGRKTDPGDGFDWDRYLRNVGSGTNEVSGT